MYTYQRSQTIIEIPYPFPIIGNLDYDLPEYIKMAKQEIVWDREIKYAKPGTKQPSGVYIWHENHHEKNRILYVGHSVMLRTRMYQHCHWRGSDKNSEGENDYEEYSPVREYIFNRPDDPLERCSNYPNGCDCIPRFFVRIFYGLGTKEELELIHLLQPMLSRQLKNWNIGKKEGKKPA